MTPYTVDRIDKSDAVPFLLTAHYLHRLCPISHAFGLFKKDSGQLCGVVTYGTPLSSTLRTGICGSAMSDRVLELNRLVCENEKNLASLLVGRSLRMLPKPSVVVSYADTSQGHVGYVYQACNFVYTGLSAKQTDWKVRGLEHKHHSTLSDSCRGKSGHMQYLRDKYGDDLYPVERSRKHRYVYFCGSSPQRKEMMAALAYKVEPYPKGDTSRYAIEKKPSTQSTLFT